MVWFFGSKKEKNKNAQSSDEEQPMEAEKAVRDLTASEDPVETDGLEDKNGKEPEEILRNILTSMGLKDEVSRSDAYRQEDEESGEIHLTIEGEHSALLIGSKGRTLDSLEYLINRICSARVRASRPRIILDMENYREKREEKLVSLAHMLAEKVAKTRKKERLFPMNPTERKIVHVALRDHESVETKSEGEGFYKKILISHKKNDQ